ncbi:MAG: hypothetical protein JNG90_09060 [Planctomycetaceae bacterium]|nr:hypothetical protein [Planctomycetaceae bacterium]
MRLTFLPAGGWIIVALVAAVLLAALFVGPARSKTTPRQRRILAGIRLGIVFLLLFGLLRPTLVYTKSRKQSSTFLIAVDRSRSMRVADSAAGQTRWQTLVRTLDECQPSLQKMAGDLEVLAYAFDADAAPVGLAEGKLALAGEPQGNQSAIGLALEQILRREAGKRLAGVLLLSDGAQRAVGQRDTPPQIPARQLANQGFPLHTVAFGQARGPNDARDIDLSDLQVNDPVFVKNEIAASALARVDGFVNDNIAFELLFETQPGKMTVVDGTSLRAKTSGEQLPVELQYVPETPGEYKLTLRAASPPGELVTTNNELSTFVTVRKGGINVLYLEGGHPVEAKFLRRSLDSSADVRVAYHWIDAEAPDTRPAALADDFRPGKFDVYILGDLDAAAFEPAELAELVKSVKAGAGLIMLGGFHSFGPGGYQQTPLAEILPVQMGALERQKFDEPIAGDLHLPGPIRLEPTPAGEQLRLMLLAPPDVNRQTWRTLPPLEGANRFRALSPLANVLAVSADESKAPLLVAQTVGNGRVLAFAGDSTWRWYMRGHEALHKRFWRQIVLWLAKKDESSEANVWIKLAARRYQPGQRVEFTAGADSADGEPLAGVELQVTVTCPDGGQQGVRTSPQGTSQAGAFLETELPGDYTVAVVALKQGQRLGAAQARFLVYEQDLELENPAADPSLLASLSSLTGGRALTPEQLPRFLDELRKQPLAQDIETETKVTPWDTWPFMLLLVGLMTGEWALRKKWGLV